MGEKSNPQTIAYQGEPGSYSEEAALEFFGDKVNFLPCDYFDSVFLKVNEGLADFGLIPLENSSAGSIHRNYDLLLRHDLNIVSEYILPVNHCLLGLPGVSLSELDFVHSHPQALAQCEKNISNLGLIPVAEGDTAGSARLIKEKNEIKRGALASRQAAEIYGLDILKENLEDNPLNFTRFAVLSLAPKPLNNMNFDSFKTSLVFSLNDRPGALHQALGIFANRDIDLTKIESRPNPEKPWDYLFYIDFDGQPQDNNCSKALEELSDIAPIFRILGSYPKHIVDNN